MTEVGELFQRLAAGGAITAEEMTAIRAHMVSTMVAPGAPVERYTCGAKLRNGTYCTQELCASNAPYGVAHIRCGACGRNRTVYFGGYRRIGNGHLPTERVGDKLTSTPDGTS